MKTLSKLLMVAALGAASAGVRAEVIDFNGLAGSAMPGGQQSALQSDPYGHSAYTEFLGNTPSHVAGYALTGYNHVYTTPVLGIHWAAGLPGTGADNGTDYVVSFDTLRVRRDNGGSFSLNGLDLTNFYDEQPVWSDYPAKTTFVLSATLSAGGKVSTVLTLDDIPNYWGNREGKAFNHFSLTGFNDITSFQIERPDGLAGFAGIAIDNLDLTTNTSPVPEPSSWAMMGLGLLGLTAYAKRRKA